MYVMYLLFHKKYTPKLIFIFSHSSLIWLSGDTIVIKF